MPSEYSVWNAVLADYFLYRGLEEGKVYLVVAPRVLAAAWGESRPFIPTAEEAKADFVATVSKAYKAWVLDGGRDIRGLADVRVNGVPQSVAFLCLSVLAAYEMRTEIDRDAKNYYKSLAALLDSRMVRELPEGFTREGFELLWQTLAKWVEEESGAPLAMPEDAGARRYLALPMSHVPLRRVDIDRLPRFFQYADYGSWSGVSGVRLESDLRRWAGFTRAGQAALDDDRKAAVLAQVALELSVWDEAVSDSAGRRLGRVEIVLQFKRRRPQLYYLPRRPPGFPRLFEEGDRAFEAHEEGWYERTPLPVEDGPLLAQGIAWKHADSQHVLRRTGSAVIPMVPSDYSDYVSHNCLLLHVRCAVMCRRDMVDAAREHILSLGSPCRFDADPELPEGWLLCSDVVVRELNSSPPPSGLEPLAVNAEVDFVAVGGLRLGGRWAWLRGARPKLIVTGLPSGLKPLLDDEEVGVAEDGCILDCTRLDSAGVHVLQAARRRRKIEIIEPELGCAQLAETSAETAIALPMGTWCLIGSRPGEFSRWSLPSRSGGIARAPFRAVWAVSGETLRGAQVICVCAELLPPSSMGPVFSSRPVQEWISAVYSASVRRPHLGALHEMEGAALTSCWSLYFQAAKSLKRRLPSALRKG